MELGPGAPEISTEPLGCPSEDLGQRCLLRYVQGLPGPGRLQFFLSHLAFSAPGNRNILDCAGQKQEEDKQGQAPQVLMG